MSEEELDNLRAYWTNRLNNTMTRNDWDEMRVQALRKAEECLQEDDHEAARTYLALVEQCTKAFKSKLHEARLYR